MKLEIINKSGYPNPEYKHLGDSGMDIRTCISSPITLKPLERSLFPTGIYIDIPDGYEIQVRSRSGMALKSGVIVLNTPGTIDSGYRNEIGVILINLSSTEVTINPGDRIAQLVLMKVERVTEFIEVQEFSGNTERNLGGYGSTGMS